MTKSNNIHQKVVGLIAKNIIIVLFFLGSNLYATSSEKSDLSKIIKVSDLVVYGVFSSVHTEWIGNKIVTKGVFDINQTYKGTSPKKIVVEYLGGTAEHPVLKSPVSMKTSSGVSFNAGEELILMLRKVTGGNYKVNSSLGKKPVVFDKKRSVNVVAGVEKIKTMPLAQGDIETIIVSELMTLDEFSDYVKQEAVKQ